MSLQIIEIKLEWSIIVLGVTNDIVAYDCIDGHNGSGHAFCTADAAQSPTSTWLFAGCDGDVLYIQLISREPRAYVLFYRQYWLCLCMSIHLSTLAPHMLRLEQNTR